MKLENQFDGTIWLSDETKKEIERIGALRSCH